MSNIYTYGNICHDLYSTVSPNQITISNTTEPTTMAKITANENGLIVSGKSKFDNDVEINGNLKINGTDLNQLLESIQSRLNILIPDPEKLEQYESLKKAYAQYKMLEALCEKK